MNPTANQSGNNRAPERPMDFAVKNQSSQADGANQDEPPIKTARPAAVTSAKDAFNARYAEQIKQPPLKPIASAREAVNAASQQSMHQDTKSASSLHHGKIQKNIERSQPSASALLRRARAPRPSPTEVDARDSFDPLAERNLPAAPATTPRQSDTEEVPVVRTSLKLGASQTKPKPVVLPPGSRMARVARPMNRPRPVSQPTGQLMSHRSLDPQMVSPSTLRARGSAGKLMAGKAQQLAAAQPAVRLAQPTAKSASAPTKPQSNDGALAVKIISSAKQAALPATAQVSAQSRTARMMDVQRPSRPSKFRPAPRDYAQTPATMPVDKSYVMTAPPKLNLAHPHEQTHVSNLEDYYAPRITPEAPTNTRTTAKKRSDDDARYAFGGESPFLKSVSVEKRPLSANSRPQLTPPAVTETAKSSKGRSARKNVYTKKSRRSAKDLHPLPERPTVIIPSSRRSKVPLFVLIVVTVILGAVVGAAAYLCFFQ